MQIAVYPLHICYYLTTKAVMNIRMETQPYIKNTPEYNVPGAPVADNSAGLKLFLMLFLTAIVAFASAAFATVVVASFAA